MIPLREQHGYIVQQRVPAIVVAYPDNDVDIADEDCVYALMLLDIPWRTEGEWLDHFPSLVDALREHFKEDAALAHAIQRSHEIDEVVAATIEEQRNKTNEEEVPDDITLFADAPWDIVPQNEFVEYKRPATMSDEDFTPKFLYTED